MSHTVFHTKYTIPGISSSHTGTACHIPVYQVSCTICHMPYTMYRTWYTIFIYQNRIPYTMVYHIPVYPVPYFTYRISCTVCQVYGQGFHMPGTSYYLPYSTCRIPCTIHQVCGQGVGDQPELLGHPEPELLLSARLPEAACLHHLAAAQHRGRSRDILRKDYQVRCRTYCCISFFFSCLVVEKA